MSQIPASQQARFVRALEPCESPPGSPERIEAYRRRAEQKIALFNRLDNAFDDDEDVLVPVFANNRQLMARHLACARQEGLFLVQEATPLSTAPRAVRPSVAARKDSPEYRRSEAERKRRERARKRREREERDSAA